MVLVWSLVTLENPIYNGVEYPGWAIAIGWLTIAFSLLFVPAFAIYSGWERGSFYEVYFIVGKNNMVFA